MIADAGPATTGKDERSGHSALSVLTSRPAWVIVAVVAVVALGIGSVHPAQPSSSARIAHLDSVIKCPSCVDLSIAQSDAPIAVGLRAEVAAWVHEGLSDAQIEQLVVARFGEQALLVPSGSGADVLLWAVPVSVVGGAGVLLGVYLWRRRRLEVSR
ncbi:MAG: cytochrome c-type biogenesis protein CcmH [Acidimicrobiales bacterium]